MDIIQFKDQLNFDFTDEKDLLDKLKAIYTVNGYTADIKITDDLIHIHVDERKYNSIKKKFEKAMSYCNNQQFDIAEPILLNIIKECPFFSDAYRTLAQIKMNKGLYEEAYDQNIEALKVDPTNLWALILMGNICMHMGEIETADEYYKKALTYHPDDYLALNNIGANYIKREEYDKAISVFTKILSKEKTYLNTYYGLALSYYRKHEFQKALDVCIDGMKQGVNKPQDRGVREGLQKLAMTVAHEMTDHFDYSIEIGMEQQKLSKMTNVPLRIDEDANLNTHARLEYYISRHRDYNRVVVNPTKKYHEHLMMHEFMHLEMNLEAAKKGKNLIIVSDDEKTAAFKSWIAPEMRSLKSRMSDSGYEQLLKQLHQGLMLQATNSALDLLVEDRIYNLYPKMRPLQMLSLVEMEIGNVESVTKASKTELPRKVVSANRIMNIVSALHLQDMYGFNIAPHYKANNFEMRKAQDLYEEYKAYKDDYKPGEEYELMTYFIESLGLSGFFEQINEIHFRDLNLPPREDAPLESTDSKVHKEQNDHFKQNHPDSADGAETMMMSMYMLGALKHLIPMPLQDVRRIALEIAMVGITGINPNNKGYKINAIPEREFGGYEFLAYYYVSWAIAIPEKLDSLGLPFKNAYTAAKQLYESQNM